MSVNERIILPVFSELVKYKPKLALLLPDEDDDEEEFDIRQLALEIISGFPWPVGVEFRRLFSAGCDSLSRGRLDQILRTVERIVQFLSFVMLAQLIEECIEGDVELPDHFRNEFKSRFSVPTLGTWVWLVRTLGGIFTDNGIEPFMPEMSALMTPKFNKKLAPWTPIRNEISHYLVNLNEEEVQTRCYEYQESLADLVTDIAFLTRYPLVTITDIRVNHRKRRPVMFNHDIKLLNNYVSDFAGKQRSYDAYADNHSVLLLKSLKSGPEFYLSLSPLIVDTHTEILDTPEKIQNIKKDIFLYCKYDRGRILYVGTEVQQCDLQSLSCYEMLREELDEYFNRLGQGE